MGINENYILLQGTHQAKNWEARSMFCGKGRLHYRILRDETKEKRVGYLSSHNKRSYLYSWVRLTYKPFLGGSYLSLPPTRQDLTQGQWLEGRL